jgi:tRNA dimethylallyltransferase
MDIGTAKVTAAERAAVVHHGLDLADPDELFTAADYVRHAGAALASIAARHRVAILVGGTGLYLRAVGRGLPLHDAGHDPDVRGRLEARLATDGIGTLAAELLARAPDVAAATDLANPRRVVRALERLAVRGDAAPPAPIGYPGPCLWLGLEASPQEHRRWIDERAAGQFRDGLLDEAAVLLGRYSPELRAFTAVGYREAFDVVRGESDVAAAVSRAAARTRQYARRQRTWFRREPIDAWLPAGGGAASRALSLVDRFLDR